MGLLEEGLLSGGITEVIATTFSGERSAALNFSRCSVKKPGENSQGNSRDCSSEKSLDSSPESSFKNSLNSSSGNSLQSSQNTGGCLQNAAPVGIISRGDGLKIVLFRGSHTLENVLNTKLFTANFVYDPVCYVKTAFEDLSADYFEEESFEDISYYRLKSADACILFKAELLAATSESCIFELFYLTEKVFDKRLRPVNRGFNCIIDAAVHATRYVMNHSPKLKAIIDYDMGIAKKCGGDKEHEALLLLKKYLEQ